MSKHTGGQARSAPVMCLTDVEQVTCTPTVSAFIASATAKVNVAVEPGNSVCKKTLLVTVIACVAPVDSKVMSGICSYWPRTPLSDTKWNLHVV